VDRSPDQYHGLVLNQPIDCVLGQDCFLQNYMDVDAGPGSADFMCLALAYDGHKGTDFRIPDLEAMRIGVNVLAAASGTVKATRDGETDGLFWEGGAEAVGNRECGNGIVLDHGNGWETQYCHLKQGSLSVKRGQRVSAGDVVAEVGLSGQTEFPHLHISVRQNGTPVDPFTGLTADDRCGQKGTSLWSSDLQDVIKYVPAGVVNQGFAEGQVNSRGIEEGLYDENEISPTSPGLVYYVRMFGLRTGDEQEYVVLRPDGSELIRSTYAHEEGPKAQYVRFVGKRRPQGGWPTGTYEGRYKLVRDGVVLIETNMSFMLR